MYTEDFFIRHRQLAESADNVLFIHTPRCRGKSWTEKLLQMSLAAWHYSGGKMNVLNYFQGKEQNS